MANMPPQELINERLAARARGDRGYFLNEQRAQLFREDVQTEDWFNSRVDHLLSVSEGHLLGGLKSMFELDLEERVYSDRILCLVSSRQRMQRCILLIA